MKISLGEVMSSKRQKIDFDYYIDLSSEEVGYEKPFKAPVHIMGSLEQRSGANVLNATIETRVFTACARCLAPIEYDKSLDVSLMLTRKIDNDEMDDIVFIESDEVDIDELLVPELVLDMDMVVLCSEDCKGLCTKCGKNLNEGECGCDRKVIDPRLAKLQELLKQ